MKVTSQLFKILILLFISFVIYLSVSLISKKISYDSPDDRIALGILELPKNNIMKSDFTIPYSGHLWVRLKNIDSHDDENTERYNENIRQKCNEKYKYTEIGNLHKLDKDEFNTKYWVRRDIDRKRRFCRDEIRFGNIVTTLTKENSEITNKMLFPRIDTSGPEGVSIAVFYDLKKDEKINIKIESEVSSLSNGLKPRKYEILLTTIKTEKNITY